MAKGRIGKVVARLAYLLAAACLLSLSVLQVPSHRAQALSNAYIVGIIQDWSMYNIANALSNVDLTKLTHLVYTDLHVTSAANATLTSGYPYNTYIPQCVTAGHNAGIKVLVSLYGQETGELEAVVGDAGLRTTLITNLSNLVTTYNLDGIDIDWESAGMTQALWALLIDDLYTAIHPSGKIITIDTGYSDWAVSHSVTVAESAKVDIISPMTYRMDAPAHSTYADSVAGMEKWAAAGYDMSKFCMGIGAYGLDNDYTGFFYRTIVTELNPTADQNQATVATVGGVSVTGGVVWWNGIDLAKQKVDYIKTNSYGGIMIFEIAEDAPSSDNRSLLVNIYNEFYPPGGPDAPTNVSATDGTSTANVTITWTKSSGATGYRVYREGTNISGLLGNVSTYTDTTATVGTITPGNTVASDGTSLSYISVSNNGYSISNGTSYSYTVRSVSENGTSIDSISDTGYRGPGTLSFQWQVSAADSNSNFSNITGATTTSFNDTSAPSDGSGRYYRCILSATGYTTQYSSANRGFRATNTTTTVPPYTPPVDNSNDLFKTIVPISIVIIGVIILIVTVINDPNPRTILSSLMVEVIGIAVALLIAETFINLMF